jgi:hypothetical protein
MNTEAAAIEQIQLEDFHNARRLVIGCPVYGRFYGSLNAWHVRQILDNPAPSLYDVPTVFPQYAGHATPRPA